MLPLKSSQSSTSHHKSIQWGLYDSLDQFLLGISPVNLGHHFHLNKERHAHAKHYPSTKSSSCFQLIEFAIPHLLQVNASHDFLKLAISNLQSPQIQHAVMFQTQRTAPTPKMDPSSSHICMRLLTVPSSGLATFHEPAAICGLFFSANVMFREESSHLCL